MEGSTHYILPVAAAIGYLLYRKQMQIMIQKENGLNLESPPVPEPLRIQTSRLISPPDVKPLEEEKMTGSSKDLADRFGLIGDSSPVGTGLLGYGWAGQNLGPKLQRATQFYNQS